MYSFLMKMGNEGLRLEQETTCTSVFHKAFSAQVVQ